MPTTEKAKEILSKIMYLTIATVSEDGQPWNAPVFSAYDGEYNFYWGSHRGSQHSRNIRTNENVFLVIYDSTVAAGKGEGVYIEATATELENPQEIESAQHFLEARHRPASYWRLEEVQGNAPVRLYRATPKKVWMNGGGEADGHYIDIRVEIDLLK